MTLKGFGEWLVLNGLMATIAGRGNTTVVQLWLGTVPAAEGSGTDLSLAALDAVQRYVGLQRQTAASREAIASGVSCSP